MMAKKKLPFSVDITKYYSFLFRPANTTKLNENNSFSQKLFAKCCKTVYARITFVCKMSALLCTHLIAMKARLNV